MLLVQECQQVFLRPVFLLYALPGASPSSSSMSSPCSFNQHTQSQSMCDASVSEVQQTQMTRAKDILTKGSIKIILDGAHMCG